MEFLNQQFSVLVILWIAGMLFGVYFDLYRVFRSRIRVNVLIDSIGDMIFWVLALLLIAPLLYWSTWMELRLYVWLTIGSGFVFYFLIFSRLLIPSYRRFWKILTWLPGRLFAGTDWLWRGFRWLLGRRQERKKKR